MSARTGRAGSIRRVGLIITATAGLVIWIVLWSIDLASGFDAILIGVAMVLIAIGVRNLLPYLPGRRG